MTVTTFAPRPLARLIGGMAWMLAAAIAAAAAAAGTPPGLRFEHKDWELACDNTRTCRAAGYQAEGDDMSLSVLLTRTAGPGRPVSAELLLGEVDRDALWQQLPATVVLAMSVDGRSVGTVAYPAGKGPVKLADAQAQALLAALPQARARIEWSHGRHRWRLSDQGAAAVLLKMDEFQGRLGTPGALVRKGSAPESSVLPALPLPVVTAVAPLPARPGDAALVRKPSPLLLKALRRALQRQDDCPEMDEAGSEERPLSIDRLTAGKVLVSGLCWMAAYNAGRAYWVVDDRPPHAAVLVTISGGDHEGGRISGGQKGRGLGDCGTSDEWVWDGRGFVHVESSTSGLCRLVMPGGAWTLPTLVTDVRPAAAAR